MKCFEYAEKWTQIWMELKLCDAKREVNNLLAVA